MKNENPLVSVVIPCYNHELFIQDCIQSVIDQNYKNIELIIIDDGSKDKSVMRIQEMVESCEERFIRFKFINRPNKGLSSTLNEALTWCEGTFFSPIASDDMMLPNKTFEQVEYLEKNDKCAGVFGEVKLISLEDIKDKRIGCIEKYSFNDIFLHNHNLPTSTQMLRLNNVVEVGGYKEDITLEDWYINLKLTEYGCSLDYIPHYFAKYRRHDDNMSSKHDIMHQGRLDIIELYRNNQLYLHAKSKAYLVTANGLQLCDKKKSFKYFYKSLSLLPSSFKSNNILKYLVKGILPYYFLKKHYGEF